MIDELWRGLIEFSEQLIVPDWGALVALLPVFLALPVVLYVAWASWRLATAPPARRGKRPVRPQPPAGIHMPGPSLAPLLAAAGAFFLVFGLVAGGPWLWAGAAILVITLLYWGREAIREYDHVGAAALPGAPVAGALPARAGTPPAGVHVPPPSFRPLLVSIAFTILVAGLVAGGWVLALGVVALVITLVGWLRDARREYVAVEAADRTGHLDLGGAPAWPRGTLTALAAIVVLAAVLGSGVLPSGGEATGEGPGAGAGASPGGGAPGDGSGGQDGGAPGASLPAADVVVTAFEIRFLEPAITVPAGRPFTIAFDNRDSVPHDIVIRDGAGTEVFRGDLVTGPVATVYDVPSIPAGQYTFVCSVHPNMTGTVTAQ